VSVSLDWLPATAFFYLLLFARIGTILMLLPALGEQSIPPRMRLSFALLFTLVLYPLLADRFPAMPGELLGILALMGHEILVGLIIGGIMRLFLLAAQVAGAVIAFQIGLSGAMAADPNQGGVQGAMIGNFLGLLGVTLIFATDLHHMALAAVFDSYMYFSPAEPIMLGDAAQLVVGAISRAFVIGVQMSAPFIVLGLVFNLGLGILQKLMPQLQVYFLAMPANIGIGLALFALLIVLMMGWYLTHFEAELAMLRG